MRQEVFISPGHFHGMNYEYHGNVAITHLRMCYCRRPKSAEKGEGGSYSILNYVKKQSKFSACVQITIFVFLSFRQNNAILFNKNRQVFLDKG